MGNKFKRVPVDTQVSKLSPLEITCGSTKCDEGLHCFKTSEKDAKKHGNHGVCKECGKDLIDWERVRKNDITDSKFVFDSLKNELIRHVFWHTKIDNEAIEIARKSTLAELRTHTNKLLKSKVGKPTNDWDGRQTPKGGKEIVNYAQHATATCCRKCIEYWHGIKKEEPMNDEHLKYCTDLVMLYIEERIPNLQKDKIDKEN